MSFQQGLSGLNASSKNLEIIGNNIANANTYGTKVTRGEFADVYAAALNGSGTNGVGVGTTLTAVAQQFTQGNITTTENPLDVAISGDGFFRMVDEQGKNLTFTRNGQFKVDAEGFIINNSGQRLTGLAPGISSGDPTALKWPATGDTMPGQVTGAVTLELNLDSRAEFATPGVLDRTNSQGTGVTLYDVGGSSSSMALYFQKTSVDPATGESAWEIFADLPGGNPATPTFLTGAIFSAAGVLNTDLSAVPLWDPAAGGLPVTFGGTSPTLNLSGMSAYAANFVVSDLIQSGHAPGRLVSVNVDKDGVVNALYTNGEKSSAGTVMLAKFRNPQGLQPVGDNAWTQTGTEGYLGTFKPGGGAVGALQSGALEESNIDLTGELVSMITAQRIYQANAQTIKTQDQVLQTLVNLR
ncbi:MAG: flagellar hook protein FlgE [Rubrivivax sp.]|jgi:flagellar hook protein FlgE|nr:flagellar hook protein FlgE [Rubrivivax sp.]